MNIIELLKSFKPEDYENGLVNLHVHTNESDGTMTPLEALNGAKKAGLKYFALSDHNIMKAHTIVQDETLIKAVEFDCWYMGVLIHILGYGVDINNTELLKLCAKDRKGATLDIVRFFNLRRPKRVIEAIHNAGGAAVFAHPCCAWAINLDNFVKRLKNLGLDGLEVYYPYKRHRGIIKFHIKKTVEKLALKHNLVMTGGTDEHGYLGA